MATRKKAARKVQFCTECGETLEGFWQEPEADDVKGVILRMARCKADGRFKGDLCSRLWIAGKEPPRATLTARKVPRGKIALLKSSIGKKIAAEGRRSKAAGTRRSSR